MEATLQVLNELEREGVLGRYAIGGAVAAIMVQTGRSKDRQRLTAFLEQATFDKSKLGTILKSYHLQERFDSWTLPLNS